MKTSAKNWVGIYRTVFPLYSETFISEQIRHLSTFSPVVITRNPTQASAPYPIVSLGKHARSAQSLLFTALGALGDYRKSAEIGRIRLLHAHFAPDATLALPIARYFGIPLVTTCHGSDVTASDWSILKSGKISGYRYLLQRSELFRYGSRFIAVSDFLRQKMLDAGFPEDKVLRHYVGIDTSRFVPWKQGQTLLDGRPFVLSVARHADVKGIDLLLKAFAALSPRHPTLHLVQIGSGTLTPVLKQLAQDLEIADRVVFLGALPSDEVLRYVQQSRMLVLSSRRAGSGAEEAFGLVLTEAAACEIPCVGTRVGGIPEALIEGETGLLANPEDISDLADKMSLLMEDERLARQMGMRARELACDVFDLGTQTRKLENIYAALL